MDIEDFLKLDDLEVPDVGAEEAKSEVIESPLLVPKDKEKDL